jgi:hypothetical protein
MGELIPSWNGDGVFTGREPHNTQDSNESFLSIVLCLLATNNAFAE